jgi:hypothetical protein
MERLETGPFQENPSLALVFDRRLLQQNLPQAVVALPPGGAVDVA